MKEKFVDTNSDQDSRQRASWSDKLRYQLNDEQVLALGAISGILLAAVFPDQKHSSLEVLQLIAGCQIGSLATLGILQSRHKDFYSGKHVDFEYGRLHFVRHAGQKIELTDGTAIGPGDSIGYISTNDNIGSRNEMDLLDEGVSPQLVAEVLLVDFLEGLSQLGQLAKENSFAKPISAITAQSHFGGTALAEKLGFEVHNADGFKWVESYLIARDLARNTGSPDWGTEKRYWKRVKRVWMSVDRLIDNQDLFLHKAQKHRLRLQRHGLMK